ncbi:MAG: cytochrome c [Gammaproteobacteria bacterium]|nr:cytochrome c [Gammaproteobacteria bacterium]
MSRRIFVAALIAASLGATAAQATGDPQNGSALFTACMGCHGIDGYRNAYPSFRVPKLGGQKVDYIVAALQAYKAGTRSHATMTAQAASLSDQDMQDIAAFVQSQGEPASGAVASAAGRDKAAVCAACHGEGGISSAPSWPNLAGQHRDYLEHTINQYRSKHRQDPVMQGQVMALTDADVRELAAYYAAQPGLFATHLTN